MTRTVTISDDATIIRGDARRVVSTLADASIDFIFSDPPYGHNNNNNDLIARIEAATGRGTPGPPRPIANDGPEANDLVQWFFSESARLLRCCCCCCCGGGGGPDPQFARWSLWMDQYLHFKQMVVWDKGKMGLGWHYRRSYETVLVAQKGKGKTAWYDETRRVENIIRPGDYGIRKIIPRASQHPTEKPVALAAHFIRLHSRPGDLILDPFMGTGSTGVAAIQEGRRFLGVELDPAYAKIAEARIRHALDALAKT